VPRHQLRALHGHARTHAAGDPDNHLHAARLSVRPAGRAGGAP
jgi:hypothetical protein